MTTTTKCDVFPNCDVLPSMTYSKVQNNQASKQAIKRRDDIVAIAHAIVTKMGASFHTIVVLMSQILE